MTEQQIDILCLVFGLPIFGMATYFWFNGAKHMLGLLNNFKPSMWWGKFIPFCVFIPAFFTDEGNFHRMKMLRYSGLFILCTAGPLIVISTLDMYTK
jgi:hypothetical protein